MANAFAQKHLRSIILNVSSHNKLCFVTSDSKYYCYCDGVISEITIEWDGTRGNNW